MKAIVIEEPGSEDCMRVGEIPAPAIERGAVRIEVRAAGVNRADLLQRQGLYPPPKGASATLGLECAGEILEVAPDVEGFAFQQDTHAVAATCDSKFLTEQAIRFAELRRLSRPRSPGLPTRPGPPTYRRRAQTRCEIH